MIVYRVKVPTLEISLMMSW